MRSPHSSENKRSAVAIKNPDRPGFVSIYVKGAPEMLINHCSKLVVRDNVQEMGQNESSEILKRVNAMAMQPLRVIGLAYLELTTEQYE